MVEFDRKHHHFSIILAHFIDERENLHRKSERSAPRESPLYEAAHDNGRAADEEEEEIESQLCIFAPTRPPFKEFSLPLLHDSKPTFGAAFATP
ncbi:MAG: hypothetical protein HXL28_03535 [Prevotellaceae bacterium]|nr:hypothetical protein [Prevotellaceae bacterium]